MKQIVQWPDSGRVELLDVPEPQLLPGQVLVRNHASAISPGTERSMIGFGRASLIEKARARPDLVRRVIQKSKTEGLVPTIAATRSRLQDPTLLGYSCAGEVVGVGRGVTSVRPGDRVACGGAGFATHSEVVSVPTRLVAPVPDAVPIEHASFAVIATIPMHGFRLAGVGLGDTVVVLGLGIVGQFAAQIAASAGSHVVAYDLDPKRCDLLEGRPGVDASANLDTVADTVAAQTAGAGADAILICAATSSSEPITTAANVARDRARIIMVGATGMSVPRRVFFEKELTLLVSRSYGPGRYDPDYEERGHDYPIGFVRWTEGRNMRAVLSLMASRGIDVDGIGYRYVTPEEAVDLYEQKDGLSTHLGTVVKYPVRGTVAVAGSARSAVERPRSEVVGDPMTLGVVGAGQFTRSVLLPAIHKAGGFRFRAVASARGVSAASVRKRHGFDLAVRSLDEVLDDTTIGTVVLATRHDQHAEQVVRSLRAGRNVFVEKPLAIVERDLELICDALSDGVPGKLFVGYNRRFAPMVQAMSDFFAGAAEPFLLHYRVNAGFIPRDHWIQSADEGGGRVIGEVCHFVDLLMHLTKELPTCVSAAVLPDMGRYSGDNLTATVRFSGGSVGSVLFTAAGDRSEGKEYLEVFCGGRQAALGDFRTLRLAAGGRQRTLRNRWRQDKGHVGEWVAIKECLAGGDIPIRGNQLFKGARCTFRILDALRAGAWVSLPD